MLVPNFRSIFSVFHLSGVLRLRSLLHPHSRAWRRRAGCPVISGTTAALIGPDRGTGGKDAANWEGEEVLERGVHVKAMTELLALRHWLFMNGRIVQIQSLPEITWRKQNAVV